MPINSMTGYGHGQCPAGYMTDIKSVNNKYLEIKIHLPSDLLPVEPLLLEYLRGKLNRGSVDVFISLGGETAPVRKPRLNLEMARGYTAIAQQLNELAGVSEAVLDIASLLSIKDLIGFEASDEDIKKAFSEIVLSVDAALASFHSMRMKEGEALKAVFERILVSISGLLEGIRAEAPKVVSAYRDRLRARIQKISAEITLDPSRLEQEVAIYAERSDITEEIDRLESHLSQFRTLLEGGDGPCGKKMDFMVQEMNREANTIGSKTHSIINASLVIGLKAELDRVREQVQNIE